MILDFQPMGKLLGEVETMETLRESDKEKLPFVTGQALQPGPAQKWIAVLEETQGFKELTGKISRFE